MVDFKTLNFEEMDKQELNRVQINIQAVVRALNAEIESLQRRVSKLERNSPEGQ